MSRDKAMMPPSRTEGGADRHVSSCGVGAIIGGPVTAGMLRILWGESRSFQTVGRRTDAA